MLILSLPLLGLDSKSTSLSSGSSVWGLTQYDMICWEFHLLQWMESMDVAGVLQETGDTESRARTKPQL